MRFSRRERERLEGMRGLITPEEGRWLAERAAQVPRWAIILEIGSHTGLSTAWLAAGARRGKGATVVAVDPWPDPGYADGREDPFAYGTGDAVLAAFWENTGGEVVAIRMHSADAATVLINPIGLLFMDSLHDYDSVRADIDAWVPRVTLGGWAAFHDYWLDPERSEASPVAAALADGVEEYGPWEEREIVWNMWTARRG